MLLNLLSPQEPRPELRSLCALGIMIKAPRPGFSKTRLSPPLTSAEAAQLSRCFLQDTVACFERVRHHESRARGVAIYTPVGAEGELGALLPPGYLLLPQREGDFGFRLQQAVEDLFAAGFGAVSLINSDSPTLPETFLGLMASRLLDGDWEAAIGPSTDGGYYAIGLRRPVPALFERITWSTATVLAETLAQAKQANIDLQLLPEWYDVDDAASLELLLQQLFGDSRLEQGTAARSTEYLKQLLAEHGWDYFQNRPSR